MKKSFSLFSSILLGLMAMMSLPVLAQSQGEEPIITFHTTVYDDSKGASPQVSFSLGAVTAVLAGIFWKSASPV